MTNMIDDRGYRIAQDRIDSFEARLMALETKMNVIIEEMGCFEKGADIRILSKALKCSKERRKLRERRVK